VCVCVYLGVVKLLSIVYAVPPSLKFEYRVSIGKFSARSPKSCSFGIIFDSFLHLVLVPDATSNFALRWFVFYHAQEKDKLAALSTIIFAGSGLLSRGVLNIVAGLWENQNNVSSCFDVTRPKQLRATGPPRTPLPLSCLEHL